MEMQERGSTDTDFSVTECIERCHSKPPMPMPEDCKEVQEGDEAPFDGFLKLKPREVKEGWKAPEEGEFCPEGMMDDMMPPKPEDGERSGSEGDERKPVKEDHWSTTDEEKGSDEKWGSDKMDHETGMNPCKRA